MQKRKEDCQRAVEAWVDQAAKGNAKPLEEYGGFTSPYNKMAMAIYHNTIPFQLTRSGVVQGSTRVSGSSFAVEHPLARAGGKDVEQYDSKFDASY